MPSTRRLPNGHTLIHEHEGFWRTDDGKFTVESDLLTTSCDGAQSRSGYCPAHGWSCNGETTYLAWTIWDCVNDDHVPAGDPYPYQTFTEALDVLKGEYK